MAGKRQPIELVIANGKKNLTKAEIKERLESEVKPIADDIIAPPYLTKKQKDGVSEKGLPSLSKIFTVFFYFLLCPYPYYRRGFEFIKPLT